MESKEKDGLLLLLIESSLLPLIWRNEFYDKWSLSGLDSVTTKPSKASELLHMKLEKFV